MPQFTMLIGLPGTGKTTHRREMLKQMTTDEQRGTFVLALDDKVFELMVSSKSTYSEVIEKYGANLAQRGFAELAIAIEQGKNIIVDADNITFTGRRKLFDMLERDDIDHTYNVEGIHFEYADGVEWDDICDRVIRRDKTTDYATWVGKRLNYARPQMREGFDVLRDETVTP